jgi:putative spermidine/putrescine transport system ATP-binding protein
VIDQETKASQQVNFRIVFDKVSKDYGSLRVVENLDLNIANGEFVSLLGPSGSGKTTLLMMLAGFEHVTDGRILVDGRMVNDIPPHRRDMGVVFQNYSLFPHMTVGENIAFPLQMRGKPRSDIAGRVAAALDMVQLGSFADRRPASLSGGQQQRVALARALVFEPGVVLMDEPLGALDKQLREQMQLDIRALHNRLGLTIVFVTHDQSEALTMSDRIAVFNKGRIDQVGTPQAIYDDPQTRFVARFIGETNLWDGTVIGREHGCHVVRLSSGPVLKVSGEPDVATGSDVCVSVRPERLGLGDDRADGIPDGNRVVMTIIDSVYQGDHIRVQLDGPLGHCHARLDRKERQWPVGAQVPVAMRPADCKVVSP